jgi:hypothetical protein
MKLRVRATQKGGGTGPRAKAMASTAPKRIAAAKKSARKPAKKPAPPKKSAARKPAPLAAPAKPPAAQPRLATPLPAGNPPPPKLAAAPAAKPAPRPAAPAAPQSEIERRKAATRRFFARLRMLEAIVGADLRKRGSVMLMQAVDQWFSEVASTTATDVSIVNAGKAVITHL